MMIADIFIQRLFDDPRSFFMLTFIVVFSVCLHEYSHAQVALWMGDSTAADRGHLTLNPLKQMGFFSILMLLVLGFAWGAVPVNPANMKNKYGRLLTSFAGPAVNLFLFALAWIFFGITCNLQNAPQSAALFLGMFGLMNFVLFVFNMLPVPGLDGWNIYTWFFPKLAMPNSEVVKGAMVILIFVAFMYVHYLFQIAQNAMQTAPVFFRQFM